MLTLRLSDSRVGIEMQFLTVSPRMLMPMTPGPYGRKGLVAGSSMSAPSWGFVARWPQWELPASWGPVHCNFGGQERDLFDGAGSLVPVGGL